MTWMLAAASGDLGGWFHTLNPFVWEFTPGVGIRWYGLAYALAFVWGWVYMQWASKRGMSRVPASRVGDAIVWIVMGVVVGGRLGYVVIYDPSLLWTFKGSMPFWGVLAINQGGMSSHGGMVGVILASWRISRGWVEIEETPAPEGTGVTWTRRIIGRCSMLHVLDMLALGTPVGLMLGRLANFINGELLGRVVAMPGEHAPWWAVRYPQEVTSGHDVVRTDEQVRALNEIAARFAREGDTFAERWDRVLRALHRGDPDLVRQLEPLISARMPSQLIQGFCEGVVLGLVLWVIARRPRRAGVIGCWFLIVYGVLRVGTEFVRLPDSHLAVQRPLGLTYGQWLSSTMIIVGLGFLVWIGRRGVEKIGGWARSPEPSP